MRVTLTADVDKTPGTVSVQFEIPASGAVRIVEVRDGSEVIGLEVRDAATDTQLLPFCQDIRGCDDPPHPAHRIVRFHLDSGRRVPPLYVCDRHFETTFGLGGNDATIKTTFGLGNDVATIETRRLDENT